MNKVWVVFRRELRSYFATPLAYVFIVIFLVLAAVFTFQVGGFLERNQADLQSFFRWHPWLYLVLIPAISMRLWAEERNSGSIELLMTFPITLWQAVVGKFLAAWCAAPDLPRVDYRQLPGISRQRRHHRRVHRQLPHGGRIFGHRHVPIGGHAQPGGGIHYRRLGGFRVPTGGFSAGA